MPGTAVLYGVKRRELFSEDINIQLGLYYYLKMLRLFRDRDLALAAYNAGPGRVMKAGYRIPRIKETINYVRRVNYAAKKFKNKKKTYSL